MSICLQSVKKVLVMGAIAVAMCGTKTMLAQDFAGKFVLSKEVRWENVTLAPGTYTYSLHHDGTKILLLRSIDGAPAYMVMARSMGRAEPSGSDHLTLEKRGDAWYVSAATIQAMNEEFFFDTPAAIPAEENRSKVASLSAP